MNIDQTVIANAEGTTQADGTDSGEVLSYLQSQNIWNYYITKPITSLPVLLSEMDTSLRGVKAPPIALIKSTDQNRVWKYKTSGHYINISGQKSGATQATVQYNIVDSFAYRVKLSSPYYVPSTMLYNSIRLHVYQQIMQ